MKHSSTFNVYSFFVLGLLIWAFSVFFYMDSQAGSSLDSESGSFGVQSAEVAPISEWIIANSAVHDLECVDQACYDGCTEVNSAAECNRICTSKECKELVATIKNEHGVAAAAAQPTQVGAFNVWKQTADKNTRNAEINDRSVNLENVDTNLYNHKIWSHSYTAECEQLACMKVCLWMGQSESFCKSACTSTSCMQLQTLGHLPSYKQWDIE